MKKELIIIAEGVIAGIIIAFPKGPAGFAVINQTIVHGYLKGSIIAMGCIITTCIISPIVLFPKLEMLKSSFEYIVEIARQYPWIMGLISFGLGLYVYHLKQKDEILTIKGAIKKSRNMFFLTIIEPSTLAQTVVIFSSIPKTLGYYQMPSFDVLQSGQSEKMLFYWSMIITTVVWYFLTIGVTYFLSQKGKLPDIEKINRFIGALFMIAGFFALLL